MQYIHIYIYTYIEIFIDIETGIERDRDWIDHERVMLGAGASITDG